MMMMMSELDVHPPFLSLQQVASALLPCIKQLVVDASEHARAALAAGINDLAPLLGKEETIAQLLPLLLQLLRDAHADVRLNVIAKLEAINDVRCCCVAAVLLCCRAVTGRSFVCLPACLHPPISAASMYIDSPINTLSVVPRPVPQHSPGDRRGAPLAVAAAGHHGPGRGREVAGAHGHHRAHPRPRAAARPR